MFEKDVLKELEDWYTYTLQGKWRYVVFTVRRSYMMALIFENITGKRMRNTHSVEFLTDAALFLRCDELADVYRKQNCFPPILLCDDVLVHGRNTNHIIEGMQETLYSLLSDEFDRNDIESALVEAIDLHVYARTSSQLLLHGEYIWKLHYTRKEGPQFLHQLSCDLSSLILRSDVTNACYIYTEHLTDLQMDHIRDSLIDGGEFVYTVYQGMEQYTKLVYLGSGNEVKAVLSLRIMKNVNQDGYRVAPFMFLPSMDIEETDGITDLILEKIPEKYGRWILDWKRIKGMRTFNEMITLLFSDVILKAFNKEYKIIIDPEDKERELDKLARNYDQYGFAQTRQMLEELLGRDDRAILSREDASDKITEVLTGVRLMMQLETGGEIEVAEEVRLEIRERVEDYFYDRGRRDEESAYELLKLPYFPTGKRSKRRARGCCFTLMELNRGYTKAESKYCMAYFLQMIDAGIGSLSSYAPNDVTVVGYAQFAKSGEQSLLIKPLRMYVYILMLSGMQVECDNNLHKLTEEITKFGTAMRWEQSQVDMLVNFVEVLGTMGQTPVEWVGSYIHKVDAGGKDGIEIIKERTSLYNAYMSYAEEK